MLIDTITEARVPGYEGTNALTLSAARLKSIDANRLTTPGESVLNARGRLIVPAFVDAHVHLDKAFLLARSAGSAPTLSAAIQTVAALRSALSTDEVRHNAERAVDELVSQGVTAARVHVEIGPAVGLELLHLQQALAARVADRIELQLVAFPQLGLEPSGTVELMTTAMAEGVAVVGGCPYVDSDPERHLNIVFQLAERYGAPIDLHLDFSDDPGQSLLSLVTERTRAHSLQGRVTIGHVTTLAAMTPDAQSFALDGLASAGIGLIVLPATDLYLAGHGSPGTRSITPISRARAHGVRVAIANNNLQNPFAPFGNGSLLQAAWLAGIVGRAHDAASQQYLFDAITSEPTALLGLEAHGPRVGCQAHLSLLAIEREAEVVRMAPAVLATLRAGRLVHCLNGPQVAAMPDSGVLPVNIGSPKPV